MSDYRNLEDIKNDFEKRLAENKRKLELWKSVKRLTKKDGSDFVNINKNFDGAELYKSWSTYYFRVSGRMTGRFYHYIEDEIYIGHEEKTAGELAELTAKRIEELTNRVDNYEKQLEALSKIFAKYNEKIEAFYKELKEDCEKFRYNESKSPIEYAIEDYVKSYYVRG